MGLHAAAVVLALAALLCSRAQGATVITLANDQTRHGIVVLYDYNSQPPVLQGFQQKVGQHCKAQAFESMDDSIHCPQEHGLEVYKYHVDTLVQARFAHTTVDVEVRNRRLGRTVGVPFAIPDSAMLTQFIVEANGKEYQARPVHRNDTQKDEFSSTNVTAHDAVSFEVAMGWLPVGVVRLRIEYEQLLTRHRGRYTNVQQIWPGTFVTDMRIGVRIKETTDIVGEVKHFVTAINSDGKLTTLDAEALSKVTSVSTATQQTSEERGLREVAVTLSPTEEEQRALAALLSGRDGVGGQFNVEYELTAYPSEGDIVVQDGYFAHFFAPSNLPVMPKYVIILLDVTNFNGYRDLAREALIELLKQLGKDDTFTIIDSKSTDDWDLHKIWDIDVPSERAACNAYGVDAVESATQNFDELSTLGGSLLLRSMEKAFRCASDGPVGREPFIVWFTEDEHEYTNEEILTLTASWNNLADGYHIAPIWALDFDRGDKLAFLEELATRNGGSARWIHQATSASLQIQDFYATIASPVLQDGSVSYQQADQTTVTQSDFRTHFSGSEVVVAGKLDGDSLEGSVFAYGLGRTVSYPFKVATRPEWQPEWLHGVANSERLWAFLRTSQLLDRAQLDGKNSEAANEATDLALEHSFVASSSCLAVDLSHPYTASTPAAPTSPSTTQPPTAPSTATESTTTPNPPVLTTTPTTDAPATASTNARPTTAELTTAPHTAPPMTTPTPAGPTTNAPPTSPGAATTTIPIRPPNHGADGVHNDIAIGSIRVDKMYVNGPLVQFNLVG